MRLSFVQAALLFSSLHLLADAVTIDFFHNQDCSGDPAGTSTDTPEECQKATLQELQSARVRLRDEETNVRKIVRFYQDETCGTSYIETGRFDIEFKRCVNLTVDDESVRMRSFHVHPGYESLPKWAIPK